MTIPDYSNMTPLTDDRLDEALELSENKPVLLYFSTDWCGPCKTYGPILNDHLGEHPELPAFIVDGDEAPEITAKYRVFGFPTTLLLLGGEAVWSRASGLDKEELDAELSFALDDIVAPTQATAAKQPARTLKTATIPARAVGGARASVRGGEEGELARPLAAGERVTLHDGETLDIQIHVDPLAEGLHLLEWLEQFPRLAIDTIDLKAESLAVEVLERALALDPAGIELTLEYPLEAEAIAMLSQSALQFVEVDLPSPSSSVLAPLLPGIIVNGRRVTPNFVPEPEQFVPWTRAEEVLERVARGERLTIVVQSAHPTDTMWLADDLEVLGSGVVFVSSFGEAELARRFPLAFKTGHAIFGVEAGEIRWRRPLAAGHNKVTGADIAAIWDSATDQALAPIAQQVGRSIEPDGTVQEIAVINDRGIVAGQVNIADQPVAIPAGWRTVRVVAIEEGDEDMPVDSTGVDELVVWVYSDEAWDASILAASDRLVFLQLMVPGELVGLIGALQGFPNLRLLRSEGLPEEVRDEIRATYPGLILDDSWPA